jgi:hypothetical protein
MKCRPANATERPFPAWNCNLWCIVTLIYANRSSPTFFKGLGPLAWRCQIAASQWGTPPLNVQKAWMLTREPCDRTAGSAASNDRPKRQPTSTPDGSGDTLATKNRINDRKPCRRGGNRLRRADRPCGTPRASGAAPAQICPSGPVAHAQRDRGHADFQADEARQRAGRLRSGCLPGSALCL